MAHLEISGQVAGNVHHTRHRENTEFISSSLLCALGVISAPRW